MCPPTPGFFTPGFFMFLKRVKDFAEMTTFFYTKGYKNPILGTQ
jgi:hypothetical protein